MLDDRYYMRETPFDTRRSVTLLLLVVNLGAFLLQAFVERFSEFNVAQYFALSLEGLSHGYVWQFITFQFMHAGLLHIFFNAWAIYMFGREVEQAIGQKSYLTLYLVSGVIGGLFHCLAALLPGSYPAPVVGASAGVFGLLAAFALLYPERILMLFFVIPMKAKWLLAISGFIAVYGVLAPSGNVAHAAHLGGLVSGIFFVRYAIHWHWQWPKPRQSTRSAPHLVRVQSPSAGIWSKQKSVPPEDLPADEFLSREVDPILDKISAHGIQSLTDRERRILEAAREKMKR